MVRDEDMRLNVLVINMVFMVDLDILYFNFFFRILLFKYFLRKGINYYLSIVVFIFVLCIYILLISNIRF